MRKEGAKVLWRGLPPTLWRDVPFSAIYWMGYEQTKQALVQSSLLASELHTSFLAGALSGMVSQHCARQQQMSHVMNLISSLQR